MDTQVLREKVREDIMLLPDDAIRTVHDFVRFQIHNYGTDGEKRKAERAAGMAILMKYKGTVDFKFDIKKELEDAYTEMYENSL